jgi:hypothetical protein
MNVTASPVDPDGLMEFSVVFTDRSLNHMSKVFQGVMNDLYAMLREVYGAEAAVIVPGGGTYAMESVARQFATNSKVLVIRNGWFSYRWTQIFEMGGIASETVVIKARQTGNETTSAFAPDAAEALAARIREERPGVVFAPHVETASGVILPDEHIKAIADAAHEVGALFVLDCIASGAIWVDMAATGVDVLISAPQKGWSASPAAGLVMLSDARAGPARRDHEHELRHGSSQMARHHAGLCRGRPCLPRDDADRCAGRAARPDDRDPRFRLRNRPREAVGARAQGPRAAGRRTATSRSPPPASRRRASSSATRRIPTSRPARSSWPKACRSPPAFP